MHRPGHHRTQTRRGETEKLYRIYGLTPQKFDSTYEAFLERVHPDDRAFVKETIEKAYRDQEPFMFYPRIVRPDGTIRILHARGNVAADEAGNPVRMFGTVQDVTELKRTEETLRQTEDRLRQAQRMEAMGKLAGEIARDFDKPTTVIMRQSTLLMGSLGKDDRLRGKIEEIKNAADQAAALTRHLLAFSSSQVLSPRLLDLNAIVTSLRGMLQWLIGKGIGLATKLDQVLGRVNADPWQIELVIMTLAGNARDAMPAGGTLTIETANVTIGEAVTHQHGVIQPGQYALLSLSDTGCGMDAETLAHLFEPFFRTKGRNKGSGLGMATVYGIVKQSGGTIVVTSEPGRGTTFRIYLPLVE